MRILLVQSYLGGREAPVFPLGLACLNSSLLSHEVKAFDTNASEKPFRELKELTKSFVPEVIGISLRNIDSTNKRKIVFYYRHLKDILDALKSHSDAKIIIGGPGFSTYARQIMEDEPRIDYGVYREGEIIFVKLLQNLQRPEKVKSVYYRKNGKILFSGTDTSDNLTHLNMPKRDALSPERYKSRDAIGVETKRGCPFNCIYCIYPFLNGKVYRLKNPMLVVDEIEQMVNQDGIEQFTFIDSVFNIPQKQSIEICSEMIKRRLKVKWSAWFSEKYLSAEFLKLIKKAGCNHIILSPDAFCDKTLKKLGKNITQKDILRTYQTLQNMNGFEISYNFFKNPPGQNLRNFVSITLFFLKAKLKFKKKVHFEFNSLRIEPHTKLYEIALKEGLITQNDNLLYPKYYRNAATVYSEKIFNLILRLKGC